MAVKGKLGNDPHDGSKRMGQLNAELQDALDAVPTITRCGVEGCTWSWEGEAADGREMFAAHRRLRHKVGVDEPLGEVKQEPLKTSGDPELEKLRDIFGLGQTLEVRLPEEPVPWRREWIESLGGLIVIDPAAPMPIELRRDRAETNGHAPAGEPQKPRERTEPMSLNQCKIDGCHEEALATRGRFAYLCADHKDEALAAARAEGSLGSRFSRRAEPEPEPAAGELVPAPAAPLPIANGSDPDRVDVFDLLGKMVTPELIGFHQAEAERHKAKAEALVSIYDELRELGVVEA